MGAVDWLKSESEIWKKKQLLHIGWTGNGSNMRSNMYVRLNVAKMFGATSSEGEF